MGFRDPNRLLKRSALATGCGCLVVVGFVSGIVYVSCSNFFANMMGKKSYRISGDNRHFDPFAKLEEIRSRVGAGARLVSIKASGVRADGTMDLEAKYTPFPIADYVFHIKQDKAPENAPPVGAGRAPDDVWFREVKVSCYQPGQRRQVTRTGGGVSTRYQYTQLGMEFDEGDVKSGKLEPELAPPKMTTQALWKIALEKGALKDAVARIEYDKSGYSFSIIGTPVRFECDLDGNVKEK